MDFRKNQGAAASNKGKILLFSYAFPPMQVQMAPTVFKPMAAIARLGYEVDVLCADSFCKELPTDTSLLPYVDEVFSRVFRISPSKGLIRDLQSWSRVFARVPDLMTVLHDDAYKYLMSMDLTQYDGVITWSPFHSINPVMVRVKKQRKLVKWIAQFSDPWQNNPLEISRLTKWWNRWHEPRAVKSADYIVHSSAYSLDLMLKNHPPNIRNKCEVIPHAYSQDLYPQRPKIKNDSITLRYVGILYGRRSPEPLFAALNLLFERRKDLKGVLKVELIGHVPGAMLHSPAAKTLPKDTIKNVPNVTYIQSLEKMYDADILLLIEADVRQNLFLPSKLSDYMGADRPIVGIAPAGASEDALKGLGCWHARPSDFFAISKAIEGAVDHVIDSPESSWCDETYRSSFSGEHAARRFMNILQKIK
jgi:glycosyltransferase involved in cell wall biosynthesis